MTASLVRWSRTLLKLQRRFEAQDPKRSATTTHVGRFWNFKSIAFPGDSWHEGREGTNPIESSQQKPSAIELVPSGAPNFG